MVICDRLAMSLIASVAFVACASVADSTWRADSATSSLLHVPSQIRFPVQAGEFSITGWHTRGATHSAAVVTYRVQGEDPTVQISLRQWDRPGPISRWVATEGPRRAVSNRNPRPRISDVRLSVAIRGQEVDSEGIIIAGNEENPSQLWIAFPQDEHVALAVMAYPATSLSDEEAIERMGALLNEVPWLAPE